LGSESDQASSSCHDSVMMEGGELKVLLFPSKDYAFTGDAMNRFA
jgi:hypothetical protein